MIDFPNFNLFVLEVKALKPKALKIFFLKNAKKVVVRKTYNLVGDLIEAVGRNKKKNWNIKRTLILSELCSKTNKLIYKI